MASNIPGFDLAQRDYDNALPASYDMEAEDELEDEFEDELADELADDEAEQAPKFKTVLVTFQAQIEVPESNRSRELWEARQSAELFLKSLSTKGDRIPETIRFKSLGFTGRNCEEGTQRLSHLGVTDAKIIY